jgi:hypothetical protein
MAGGGGEFKSPSDTTFPQVSGLGILLFGLLVTDWSHFRLSGV